MSSPLRQPPTRQLRIFLSYARDDQVAVQSVQAGLDALHHETWIDRKLDGGQAWWDEICKQICDCDAMLVAVSPALLESDAALSERTYARQLGKPILPVLVAPVLIDLLPPDLAPLQLVDYTNVGPMTGFQLAGALAALPPAPSLPDRLPDPPPVPTSYLVGLADRVRGPSQSLEEQLALVGMLKVALERPRERAAASELLQTFSQRRDLYHATWQELSALLRRATTRPEPNAQPVLDTTREPGPPADSSSTAPVPAGWYPDPSGRHRWRWFDGDWTEYASDAGTIIEDPDF